MSSMQLNAAQSLLEMLEAMTSNAAHAAQAPLGLLALGQTSEVDEALPWRTEASTVRRESRDGRALAAHRIPLPRRRPPDLPVWDGLDHDPC